MHCIQLYRSWAYVGGTRMLWLAWLAALRRHLSAGLALFDERLSTAATLSVGAAKPTPTALLLPTCPRHAAQHPPRARAAAQTASRPQHEARGRHLASIYCFF